jgi:hypothetical protein
MAIASGLHVIVPLNGPRAARTPWNRRPPKRPSRATSADVHLAFHRPHRAIENGVNPIDGVALTLQWREPAECACRGPGLAGGAGRDGRRTRARALSPATHLTRRPHRCDGDPVPTDVEVLIRLRFQPTHVVADPVHGSPCDAKRQMRLRVNSVWCRGCWCCTA